MTYSLGQAKLVPGQISFQTTRTGRLPSLQPLIEAGLPIAPYIEHGSWQTGQPSIMRYGLDPYRGIMGVTASDETGWFTTQPIIPLRGVDQPPEPNEAMRERTEEMIQRTVASGITAALLIGTGAVVGGGAGAAGGALGRPFLGGLLGTVGGGLLGYLAFKKLVEPLSKSQEPSPSAQRATLDGTLAVL